jgi:hypothetical protein
VQGVSLTDLSTVIRFQGNLFAAHSQNPRVRFLQTRIARYLGRVQALPRSRRSRTSARKQAVPQTSSAHDSPGITGSPESLRDSHQAFRGTQKSLSFGRPPRRFPRRRLGHGRPQGARGDFMEIACDDVQARTASARAPTLWLEPKRGGAGFDHQTVIDLILVNPGFCLSFLTSCAFFSFSFAVGRGKASIRGQHVGWSSLDSFPRR